MSCDRYVHVAAEQPWTTDSALRLVENAKEKAEQMKVHRILLDLRLWESPTTDLVRYDSGMNVAELLRPPYRVAVLAKKAHVNHFAENVAVNRGAMLKIFFDETSALEWLLV